MGAFFVYILQCSDGSYYVGHAEDLHKRVDAHNRGQAAAHTRSRRPVTLVYSERATDEAAAMGRGRQIKRWSRARKAALIVADLPLPGELSQSRD